MAAVSEDDIIKRKLLIEGDGGNDDRRISSLLKTFVKWCEPTETPEESNNTYQKMLSVLAQCEMTMEKTAEVYDMHAKEQEHYEMLNRQIEQQIQEAYVHIADCKNELLTAKCVRRNRQEYDALAKVIQQHPDRQETMRKLEELDKELESYKETKQSLQSKLELRRKQFHLLVVSLHEMERMLQDDGLLDEAAMDQS